MFYLPMFCVKEPIKMARLHSCIRASISILSGFSGTNTKRILTEFFPPSNYQTQAIKFKGKSPWTVPTSSSVIQRKREKAKRMKNNFKKLVHNRKARSSDKDNGNDCCKDCRECYCVTKGKCD